MHVVYISHFLYIACIISVITFIGSLKASAKCCRCLCDLVNLPVYGSNPSNSSSQHVASHSDLASGMSYEAGLLPRQCNFDILINHFLYPPLSLFPFSYPLSPASAPNSLPSRCHIHHLQAAGIDHNIDFGCAVPTHLLQRCYSGRRSVFWHPSFSVKREIVC